MAEIVVVADDLTGANATGVLFEHLGCKIATFLDLVAYFKEEKGIYQNYNVIAINTDSRSISPEKAYNRVYNVCNSFKDEPIKLLAKRIDSTVRGNVGSELDAVLDALNNDYIAIVVPAFPASKRIIIGGHLLVDSIPLERTDVAKDPKTPVCTSCVKEIIAQQSKYKIASLELNLLAKSKSNLKSKILELKKSGNKIIVCDSVNQQDINRIAAAVAELDIPIVAADPGPFTFALAANKITNNFNQDKVVLATIGSATNLTRTQVANLEENVNSFLVLVDSKKLLSVESEAEISRVANKIMANLTEHNLVGMVSSKTEEDVFDLNAMAAELNLTGEEIAERISNSLAEISRRILTLAKDKIGGLFTSGGDITIAVLKAIDTVGIDVQAEILPLAVYGEILGGDFAGLPIVTKGGLIGEADAITECVNYLFKK